MKTKKIRINLSALTRVEYSEVVEVAASICDSELDALVEEKKSEIDGTDYNDDTEYWEENPGYWEDEEEDD